MNWLEQLAHWLYAFKPFYVCRPWEVAIRVRAGKFVTVQAPGFHLRIPIMDDVFIQDMRTRVLNLPTQTVSIAEREAITFSGVVMWRVTDIDKLYKRLHTPDDWMYNYVMGLLAEVVFKNPTSTPVDIAIEALKIQSGDGELDDCGVEIEDITLTDFARVRTFRFITGEGNAGWSWTRVGTLDTATR